MSSRGSLGGPNADVPARIAKMKGNKLTMQTEQAKPETVGQAAELDRLNVMLPKTETWNPAAKQDLCPVCAKNPVTYRHKVLLHVEAGLCFSCFCVWYDGGGPPALEEIYKESQRIPVYGQPQKYL